MNSNSKLKLGSTYLYVKNMSKSLEFYSAILEMQPTATNKDRWAQFNFNGNCIALRNKTFDDKLRNEQKAEIFSGEYLKYYENHTIKYGNNFALNFWIEDLQAEYERIKKLDIIEMSPIMTINFSTPYHFFVVKDPDGNTLEITGLMKWLADQNDNLEVRPYFIISWSVANKDYAHPITRLNS